MVSAMHPRALPRRQRGVSLFELIVALAIFTILATLAVPSFTQMVASQRVKSASSDLYSALVRARSEAIKRNADVTLAPVDGSWQKGWTINDPSNPARPLASHSAVPNVAITGPASITYTGGGRLRATARPSLGVSSASTDAQRCLSADLSGRPYLKPTAC